MIEYGVFFIHDRLRPFVNIFSLVDFSIRQIPAQKKNQTDNEKNTAQEKNTRNQPFKIRIGLPKWRATAEKCYGTIEKESGSGQPCDTEMATRKMRSNPCGPSSLPHGL
tara:strand:+ start:243 stop:569 length:327 start_codon:yes stop_codon:yes gene_type:complete